MALPPICYFSSGSQFVEVITIIHVWTSSLRWITILCTSVFYSLRVIRWEPGILLSASVGKREIY